MNNLDQNGGRNGGRDDRRSGAGDVFFNAEPEEWSRRRSKKRKTRTSNTESQSKIDIEQFKTLNTDDKLSALFIKFNSNTEFLSSIEDKVNQCLQISSITDYNKSCIDDHESRLLLLEYKSIDIEARSRHKSSVYLGILGQPFLPIFAYFCSFFPKFSIQDHFSKSLKNLKQHRYIIQSLHHHIIYLTNSSKSSQLNSISLKLFKEFSVISNIYI